MESAQLEMLNSGEEPETRVTPHPVCSPATPDPAPASQTVVPWVGVARSPHLAARWTKAELTEGEEIKNW